MSTLREQRIVASGVIPYFNRIELDPPWDEQGGGKSKRGIRYPGVKTKDMPGVIEALPLWKPDPDGCHVWMWCVSHRVAKGEAAEVFKALGIRMVRKLVWTKRGQMGIGQYARGAHEDLCLGVIGENEADDLEDHHDLCLGILGKLKPLASARSVRDVIDAPVPRNAANARIHSRKPQEAINTIGLITPPGPTAELFARQRRSDAWTCGYLEGEGAPLVYAPPTEVIR